MIMLSRQSMLAIAAVVDVALHARPMPVAAKALAARHDLPPRRLETLLQALVRANILKGVRGPRGGYELARERRRISAADIIRAALESDNEGDLPSKSRLLVEVVTPAVSKAGLAMLRALEGITVDTLCEAARDKGVFGKPNADMDFTI